MNGAQRAAFIAMLRIAEQMSNACFNLAQHTPDEVLGWRNAQDTMRDLQQCWDAARNRYFELEAEAKQSRIAHRRASLGSKSNTGR